jgi:hypothetical protein
MSRKLWLERSSKIAGLQPRRKVRVSRKLAVMAEVGHSISSINSRMRTDNIGLHHMHQLAQRIPR